MNIHMTIEIKKHLKENLINFSTMQHTILKKLQTENYMNTEMSLNSLMENM